MDAQRYIDKVLDREINRLIMDYLVNEGYPEAASKFASEAKMAIATDFDNICDRVQIRDAIHSGDMQAAIEKINELDPQVRPLPLLILASTTPRT